MLRLKSSQKTALLLIMICLCGLGLRLFQIAQESISLDEATSLNVARMSLKDLNLHLLKKDIHPPLYFVLLHFWQKADQGIIFLRLFSVLIGLLTFPSIYLLGKALFDRSTGLIAAFFLAISPVHISSSQNVRGYVLLLLWTVLGLYSLFRAASSGKWLWWVLYFVATMASLFTHYIAVFTVFFQGLLVPLALIIKRVPFRRWHQWVLISGLVGLFFTVWIVNSGILSTGVSPGWLSYEPAPSGRAIIDTISSFSLGDFAGHLPRWFRRTCYLFFAFLLLRVSLEVKKHDWRPKLRGDLGVFICW